MAAPPQAPAAAAGAPALDPKFANLPAAAQAALAAVQAKFGNALAPKPPVAPTALTPANNGLTAQAFAAAAAASAAVSLAAAQPTGQQLQKKFVTEYEINDFPNQARAKVVRKDFLDGIQELTGVVIICRGSYYPPGRNPPAGERKLYLLIESDSDVAVAEAQKELKRALQDVAATAAPALDGKYGKYRL